MNLKIRWREPSGTTTLLLSDWTRTWPGQVPSVKYYVEVPLSFLCVSEVQWSVYVLDLSGYRKKVVRGIFGPVRPYALTHVCVRLHPYKEARVLHLHKHVQKRRHLHVYTNVYKRDIQKHINT